MRAGATRTTITTDDGTKMLKCVKALKDYSLNFKDFTCFSNVHSSNDRGRGGYKWMGGRTRVSIRYAITLKEIKKKKVHFGG